MKYLIWAFTVRSIAIGIKGGGHRRENKRMSLRRAATSLRSTILQISLALSKRLPDASCSRPRLRWISLSL